MEIKIKNAKAALKTADESVKKVLLALLPELNETETQTAANRPITERVKTFEDACRELGIDHPFVLAYKNTNLRDPEVAEENRDILAYMKLRIIAAAMNEGWKLSSQKTRNVGILGSRYGRKKNCQRRVTSGKPTDTSYQQATIQETGRASLLRARVTPPRMRLRASVLAFALRAKLSPRIAANNLSIFGLTSTLSENNTKNKNNMTRTTFKKIPFDLELAKKITNKEVKGRIVTEDGLTARIVCFDMKFGVDKILAVLVDCGGEYEIGVRCNLDGTCRDDRKEDKFNLHIEVPTYYRDYSNFVPQKWQPCLVRDNENHLWGIQVYSHTDCQGKMLFYNDEGYVIPYTKVLPLSKVTARLIGTTKNYEQLIEELDENGKD